MCAPNILNPVSLGSNLSPMEKATSVELFRENKYFYPFLSSQFEFSDSGINPEEESAFLQRSTTWKGE